MTKTANLDFFRAGVFSGWDIFETDLVTWHY
jgi:hypothetical protein